MGLDSVEIVLCWEDSFGLDLPDSEVEQLTTPAQAIALISAKLEARDEASFCPSMRAFHRVRTGLRAACGDPRLPVSPGDHLRRFTAGRRRRAFWKDFGDASGLPGFEPPEILFKGADVGDCVQKALAVQLRRLLKDDEQWTQSLVRAGVRSSITYVVGVSDFADEDRFVEDIGVD